MPLVDEHNTIYEVVWPEKLNLGLIETLVLTTNEQEMQRTKEHVKCHHRDECKKSRLWETLQNNKSGFFNKYREIYRLKET